MFRSRRTYEEYLNSIQNEDASPENLALDLESDEDDDDDDDDVNDEDNVADIYFDPDLVDVPEGFNDDEEVLVIDGEGIVIKLRGRINVKTVQSLDAPKKILVPLNKFLQPVKKAGSVFNRFLADVARRPELCPLQYKEWRLVPGVVKDRIIAYVRKKFMLPTNALVDSKVLSFVAEKLRGYKRSLRVKYITKDTTKEQLYALPLPESAKENEIARPKGVGDPMWFGFVDLCFSEKFKQYSEIGKRARGKLLHTHTSGSQSYAVKRDKFEREHSREPGPIEWFIETHETKAKTFHEPVTTTFVESTKTMIKEKTGSSEVQFSKETLQLEKCVYRKLMGDESSGKLTGFGSGVSTKDLRGTHQKGESKLLVKVLNKMLTMQNQIDILTAKVTAQAANSQPESSTGSPQNLVNDTPCDQRSHESRMSGDTLSVSRALVQRGASSSKHINEEPSKQQKQPKNIQYVLKPSNYPTLGGRAPTHGQPINSDGRPTPSGGAPIISSTSNQKRTIPGMNNKFNELGNSKRPKSNVVYPLSYEEVMKITEKVLKKNPDSVRKYARGEKKALTLCYLAGMVSNACDYKADPHMIDKALLERLQNVNNVEAKASIP